MSTTETIGVEKIKDEELVNKANRQDLRFAIIGFVVMLLTMTALLAMIIDFMIDGVPRISWDFLTNYPSRRPEQAGILSAWVGTTLVMVTTAALAVPIGVAAGIYLEEYARKNWITDVIEINVTNLAGVPSIIYGLLALGLFVYGMKPRANNHRCRYDACAADSPDRHRCHPGGAAQHSAGNARSSVWHGSRQVAGGQHVPIAGGASGNSHRGDRWHVARHRRDGAYYHDRGVELHRLSSSISCSGRISVPELRLADSPFTVMPIQMFNWISRPQPGFHVAAAATGVILLAMTLLMNGLAIYIRYRIRRSAK